MSRGQHCKYSTPHAFHSLRLSVFVAIGPGNLSPPLLQTRTPAASCRHQAPHGTSEQLHPRSFHFDTFSTGGHASVVPLFLRDFSIQEQGWKNLINKQNELREEDGSDLGSN